MGGCREPAPINPKIIELNRQKQAILWDLEFKPEINKNKWGLNRILKTPHTFWLIYKIINPQALLLQVKLANWAKVTPKTCTSNPQAPVDKKINNSTNVLAIPFKAN